MSNYEEKMVQLKEDVREASKAFPPHEWPNAWLFLGDAEMEWYDSNLLLGLPVYHSPAFLKHSGHDGEPAKVVPLWDEDVSGKDLVVREFFARLAKSGDF